MVAFCVDILSLFLVPFQDVFLESVLAAPLLIVLICFPVLFLIRIFRRF